MFNSKTIEITGAPQPKSLIARVGRAPPFLYLILTLICKVSADKAVDFVERDIRLRRFCRLHENFTVEECDSLDMANFTHVKNATYALEEDFVTTTNIISIPLSLLVISLAAPWSDRHGRLCLIKTSIVGYLMAALCYTLFVRFESWPVEVLLAATVLRSVAGGPSFFPMAFFSMTVDKTDSKTRPLKIGVGVNCLLLTRLIGYGTGLACEAKPFWALIMALLYYILALFMSNEFLQEDEVEHGARVPPRDNNPVVDLLHPKNVSDLWAVALKARPQRQRVHLLLILFVTFFVLFSPPSFLAEWEMTYLGWGRDQFIVVTAVYLICGQIFTIVVIRLTEKSPIPDCLLAATAEGMIVLQDLMLITVVRPDLSGIVYGAMVFSIWHNLSDVGIRLALSNIGGKGEIGKIFGILAMQETVMTFAQKMAFRSFWDATRDYLVTSQHVLSAFFGVLNSAVLFGVFMSERHLKKNGRQNEKIRTIIEDCDKYKSGNNSEGTVKSGQGHVNMAFETNHKY
ncbi:proton-coupled folate transporter-like [Palaemon carinicauda]|uniref:proton-coupled folate transporter-like n=1 Tax=Palaemon carinicauda TaxID=392227 RepID=UPI0035B5B3DA